MHFPAIDNKFVEEFFKITDAVDSIVITGHKSPDDDSIASTLSVYSLLKNKYPQKKITPVCMGDPEKRFGSFQYFSDIQFLPDIIDIVKETDLLIVLDGSQYDRFTEQSEILQSLNKKIICIDHHSSPINTFDLSLVIPSFSSNSEIIYRTLYRNQPVDQKTAEIFLLGILGDTGNFNYLKPHQTETLIVAKEIMDIAQVEIQEFKSRYCSISPKAFSILQQLIQSTTYHDNIGNWPAFQTSFLDRDFLNQHPVDDNQISEAGHLYTNNYLRTVTGYSWGFIITAKSDGRFNISLRSLPKSVSVRTLMEQMGRGGGHDRAAGGTFRDKNSAQECVDEIITWLQNHEPVIN